MSTREGWGGQGVASRTVMIGRTHFWSFGCPPWLGLRCRYWPEAQNPQLVASLLLMCPHHISQPLVPLPLAAQRRGTLSGSEARSGCAPGNPPPPPFQPNTALKVGAQACWCGRPACQGPVLKHLSSHGEHTHVRCIVRHTDTRHRACLRARDCVQSRCWQGRCRVPGA